MKMLSRVLFGGALTAGFVVLAGSAASADDHWIACPGTSTLTACVGAETGDVTFESSTLTYSDCGHLTSPDGCEIPINQSVPIVSPVVEPPSAELYLQCGDEECVIPNPPPINPGPVIVIDIVRDVLPGTVAIQIQ